MRRGVSGAVLRKTMGNKEMRKAGDQHDGRGTSDKSGLPARCAQASD